ESEVGAERRPEERRQDHEGAHPGERRVEERGDAHVVVVRALDERDRLVVGAVRAVRRELEEEDDVPDPEDPPERRVERPLVLLEEAAASCAIKEECPPEDLAALSARDDEELVRAREGEERIDEGADSEPDRRGAAIVLPALPGAAGEGEEDDRAQEEARLERPARHPRTGDRPAAEEPRGRRVPEALVREEVDARVHDPAREEVEEEREAGAEREVERRRGALRVHEERAADGAEPRVVLVRVAATRADERSARAHPSLSRLLRGQTPGHALAGHGARPARPAPVRYANARARATS